MDFSVNPVFLGLVPIVIALVTLVKMYVSDHWAPLFSLAFGVVGSIIVSDLAWGQTVIAGIMVGLMASGLYSGVKSMVK